jgi:uncharacterized membrane-anchored protein YhcB (DUF1043 family)
MSDDGVFDAKWFRGLVIAAVVSGAGNGALGISRDASDRYKGEQARRDFAIRDFKIDALRAELSKHLAHSAQYTEKIDEQQRKLERIERHHEVEHKE